MTIKKLIGTDPNQVPLNRDLGGMAYQDPTAVSILGGIVRGESGSVSGANGVATSFITLPDVPGGCWIVNAYISTGAAATWSSTYLVNTQGSSVVITALRAAPAPLPITNSGLTLQVTQSSGGGPFDIVWSTLRIL